MNFDRIKWAAKFLLILCTGLTLAGHADEAPSIRSSINLYGKGLLYGSPPWLTGDPAKMLEQIKTKRHQNGNFFMLEMIPANEEFETWTQMFAVTATRVGRTVPVSFVLDNSKAFFEKSCKGLDITILAKTEYAALSRVDCPKTINSKGYGKDTGQIGLFVDMVHEGVLISHYAEFRGQSFDVKDPKSWPVTQQTLDGVAEQLMTTTVVGTSSELSFVD